MQYFKASISCANAAERVLMKILLQSKRTRDYVDQGGGWTWKQGRARVFDTGWDAIMFCLNSQVLDMQLVCVYDDLSRNFTVPVTDARHSP